MIGSAAPRALLLSEKYKGKFADAFFIFFLQMLILLEYPKTGPMGAF
jgi:hypothetical protein